jgi:hypothetical protein
MNCAWLHSQIDLLESMPSRRRAILGQFNLAEQQNGFSHLNGAGQWSVGILNDADDVTGHFVPDGMRENPHEEKRVMAMQNYKPACTWPASPLELLKAGSSLV